MLRFAEYLELQDFRQTTKCNYYRVLRIIPEHFKCDPSVLSEEQLRSFFVHVRCELGWAPQSIRQFLAGAKHFYRGMLPVPYFMVTFTLPEQLRAIMLSSRQAIELFFQCSSQALHDLLTNPRHTGFTRNGFFGVYQSWRQDMGYHPHIHYIVPAVGLSAEDELRHLKNPQWLLPAKPLALRLRTLLSNKLLTGELIDSVLFQELVKLDWNASVDPAGSGENAVKYLGNYVQRSVISDKRVLAIEGEKVRITLKDRATGKYEPRTMAGVEFIRRYLLHALPKGFHRIRYRGFLHARGKFRLQWLQVLLGARIARADNSVRPLGRDYTSVVIAELSCNWSEVLHVRLRHKEMNTFSTSLRHDYKLEPLGKPKKLHCVWSRHLLAGACEKILPRSTRPQCQIATDYKLHILRDKETPIPINPNTNICCVAQTERTIENA